MEFSVKSILQICSFVINLRSGVIAGLVQPAEVVHCGILDCHFIRNIGFERIGTISTRCVVNCCKRKPVCGQISGIGINQ
jgi:hypothetical protein